MRIVIVGAGQAAVQLAASLRQEGHEGEIVLLGDEPGLPYQRPPLSKAYMKEGDADRLILKPQSFFEKNRIERRESLRVKEIDRAGRQVTSETGETIAYDHLVLATGARNARPPIEGADHESVVELRTLAHAADIRDRLARSRRAVIVGGGFIGLEFAAMAEAAGVATTVVEAGPRLMARAVSPAISERFKAFHRAAGTEVLLDAPAARILAPTGSAADRVVLADGSEIMGDLVMVATGVKPNVELAEAAGLAVLNGITVDESLSTGDETISAIGDCASVPGPLGIHLRLESVQAATDQARHLARRLVTGCRETYQAVPWFWSDQGSLKLQIAGLSQGADHFHSLGEETVDTVFGFRAGTLVSVETVNQPGQHMAARKLLAGETPISREAIEAAGFDLRALAKGQAPARAAE
ncbi:3-phenylpropionate/trans-cinnamate dioxygenase ferredoxin reductase subunit [Fulvimarina manganoxydans]|uniref:3-phenylpropionate/trans-cinnamate dioxygenase ferredoxin reductase subunit n=1 Tax=Fulvimarina manganoxydans TaxID=937218 RepID=A0A1W2BNE9_9HYPH|nr:FAD-dependent oxidoreductase [Fulvimarina manganoxydans]SMC74384.1 3-phenylpropionate/trans-cinnamate dioxygenase ferredoxin reductase subunit [Fulvimarina manganoxydans]